jgi:hypothetical protein
MQEYARVQVIQVVLRRPPEKKQKRLTVKLFSDLLCYLMSKQLSNLAGQHQRTAGD